MSEQNATHPDAELVLRLYDFRREAEMRKARNWFFTFTPADFDEFQKVMFNFGAPENAWLRQVISYWDMAAALVNRGAFHPGLFFDTCGEGYFVYTKLKPFIAQTRQLFNSPEFMANLERVIEGSAEGRERVSRMEQNIARMQAMRKAA